MAKQIGDIIITGTIDDITFYQMDSQGYARKKSSLTGKRVKKDPRFKRTMESARRLGRGSQLASKVYRSLPRAEQVYALFKELKRMAVLGIKEGKNEAEVLKLLEQYPATSALTKSASQTIPHNNRLKRAAGVGPCPTLYRVYGRKLKQVVREKAGQPLPVRDQRRYKMLRRSRGHRATNIIQPNNTGIYGQRNADG
jgi:hypothetical protein